MGHQEWTDATRKACFVPSIHLDDFAHYGVSHAGKGITLIACCGADGSYIKPAVIITRKPFEDEELAMMRLTSEKVDLYHQGMT
jgi:hypothetical protein